MSGCQLTEGAWRQSRLPKVRASTAGSSGSHPPTQPPSRHPPFLSTTDAVAQDSPHEFTHAHLDPIPHQNNSVSPDAGACTDSDRVASFLVLQLGKHRRRWPDGQGTNAGSGLRTTKEDSGRRDGTRRDETSLSLSLKTDWIDGIAGADGGGQLLRKRSRRRHRRYFHCHRGRSTHPCCRSRSHRRHHVTIS